MKANSDFVLQLLYELGFVYLEDEDRFWSYEHEAYLNVSKKRIEDLDFVIRCIVEFEKEFAYYKAISDTKRKIKNWINDK